MISCAADPRGKRMRSGARHEARTGARLAKPKNARATLLRLLSYFRRFRLLLLGAVVAVVIYTGLGLVGPYLMGVALDRYIAGANAAGLSRVALGMLAAYLLEALFQVAASWFMACAAQRVLHELRRDLFGHLQELPLAFFDRRPAGEVMSALNNDVEAINQAVAQNVTTLVASVLSMAGILVAMFALNAWLALASVVVGPLMFGFARFVAVYTRRGFKDLQHSLGELNGVMEERISGHSVVKVFRHGDATLTAFRRSNEASFEAGVLANTYALLVMPLTAVLGNLFVVVLAGLGGLLALSGQVTVGVMSTFISYGQNFVNPLRQLANLYNSIQAALGGAERVFEVLDTSLEGNAVTGGLPRVRGHVRFEEVGFSYRAGTPVFRELTFEALPGQVVALVGATGAGKTTIINLLTRFYEIDCGAIRIDGTDIREFDRNALRRQLGLVLQDTYLFAKSVRENIRYGRLDATDEEVKKAACLADADHFIRQLPQGYDTVLSERAGNLSRGQRQLLSIARTLLADPAILILDEATSSIDTRTELRLQRSLVSLMRGRTSLVIAHRLSTIREADRVLVIDGGRIIESGTHTSLLEQDGFYRHLYMRQFNCPLASGPGPGTNV